MCNLEFIAASSPTQADGQSSRRRLRVGAGCSLHALPRVARTLSTASLDANTIVLRPGRVHEKNNIAPHASRRV